MHAPVDSGLKETLSIAPPGIPTVAPARGADIIAVDDEASNLRLLESMLRRKGHQVRTFSRGPDALQAARQRPPELVLLDISMPGMDGYEICKQLKSDPLLAPIPVIFLSGWSHASDKVKAFRAGGLDYISKPFEFDEVYARVETHLKLHRLQKELRDQNLHLDEMVQARTRELAAAHQRLSMLDQAKSQFLRLISHELRTPLHGLLGTAELILGELGATPSAQEFGELLEESSERILSLVDSALLLTQIEIEGGRFPAEPVSLGEVLAQARQGAARLATARSVRIEIPTGDTGWTSGHRDVLVRAWRTLIETAVKFSGPGDAVVVSPSPGAGEDELTVAIETSTGTIPAAALAKFFDIFAIGESSTPAGSLGLNPAVASRIISLFGGSVTVENLEPAGIRLLVRCDCADSRCA